VNYFSSSNTEIAIISDYWNLVVPADILPNLVGFDHAVASVVVATKQSVQGSTVAEFASLVLGIVAIVQSALESIADFD